jgi:exopolyphosphatase/guanosine-5'-triphosphate,3'-diphosphate pyrophosphatase
VLSVGTNSTRMLLADMVPLVPHVEAQRTIGTRIGEGLAEEGLLRDDAIARTLDAIGELKREIDGRYDVLLCISTSALRRASNSQEFARRIEELTGEPLQILSGELEARGSFIGAVASANDAAHTHGVVDVGGGSTEYAIGAGDDPQLMSSYEIGAVRLTEQFPSLAGAHGRVDWRSRNGARAAVSAVLEPLRSLPPVEEILCVGGSATTAFAVLHAGEANGDESFTLQDLARIFDQLCGLELEARKRLPGMRPQRADILPAGVLVLDVVLAFTGHERGRVARGDLLLGTLLQERERRSADDARERPSS